MTATVFYSSLPRSSVSVSISPILKVLSTILVPRVSYHLCSTVTQDDRRVAEGYIEMSSYTINYADLPDIGVSMYYSLSEIIARVNVQIRCQV